MIRIKKQRFSRTRMIRDARKWISQTPGKYHFRYLGISGNRARELRKALGREGNAALRILETAYGPGRILVVRGIPDYERDMVTIEVFPMWEQGWEPEAPTDETVLH
jgi:hypothetical protein